MKPKQIMKNLWQPSTPAESVAFDAVVKFYRTATESQIQQFEKVCKANDWQTFKKLMKNSGIPPETNSCLTPSIDDPPDYLRTAKHDKSKTIIPHK